MKKGMSFNGLIIQRIAFQAILTISTLITDHLPPIREEPGEVETISIDQIEVKKYVGGLIKSFERKAA